MSANGATKRDLFRVIGEKDVKIARLESRVRELEAFIDNPTVGDTVKITQCRPAPAQREQK